MKVPKIRLCGGFIATKSITTFPVAPGNPPFTRFAKVVRTSVTTNQSVRRVSLAAPDCEFNAGFVTVRAIIASKNVRPNLRERFFAIFAANSITLMPNVR